MKIHNLNVERDTIRMLTLEGCSKNVVCNASRIVVRKVTNGIQIQTISVIDIQQELRHKITDSVNYA